MSLINHASDVEAFHTLSYRRARIHFADVLKEYCESVFSQRTGRNDKKRANLFFFARPIFMKLCTTTHSCPSQSSVCVITDISTWVSVNTPNKVLLLPSSFFPLPKMSNVFERTVNIGLIVLIASLSTNLDPFLAQEVGGGVQHVGGVSGVVVGVGRVVAALHQLQPRAQRRLRAVEELAHAEAGEDLQAEVSQRSAPGCKGVTRVTNK